MYFPKMKTYSKVFTVLVGLGILGIICLKADLKDLLIDLVNMRTRNEEELSLPHIEFRRSLASRLLRAVEDVRWGRHAVAISKIEAAAAILDNRYYFSNLVRPPSSGLHPGWIPMPMTSSNPLSKDSDKTPTNPFDIFESSWNQSERARRLFPEVDMKSFFLSDSSHDLSSLVTILIDECPDNSNELRKEKIGRIVAQIREQWTNVKILIGASKSTLSQLSEIQNGNDVLSIEVTCDSWNRAPINPLMSYVSTPYVLFLESTAAVTADLNITRLLKVLVDMKGVGVVGIAERGVDGGWDYTCSQLYHKNAHLSIIEGYEYSQAACLFCDVTSSSFLAATSVLQIVQPDSSLPTPVRQIDWAIRLHGMDVLTLTCPDVMIHTTNKIVTSSEPAHNLNRPCTTKEEKIEARNQHLLLKRLYRQLAQRLELNSISLPNKTLLEYNCLEIHYECQARSKVKEFILPPCCLKLKNKMLENFNIFAKEALIPYRIEVGSLLGAVKFKGAIPWDFDEDVIYENSDISTFQKNKERMKTSGIPPVFQVVSSQPGKSKHNYIHIEGKGGFAFDSWGIEELADEVYSIDIGNIPKNIPCLQFGHYPIPIHKFLHDSSNITNIVLKSRNDEATLLNQKRALVPKTDKIARGLLKPKTYPSIPKPRCFLHSFARIGNLWVPAPINPGLHSLKRYGESMFKHQPHWRFLSGSDDVWPRCSAQGHPMCLNIHSTDGSIAFL